MRWFGHETAGQNAVASRATGMPAQVHTDEDQCYAPMSQAIASTPAVSLATSRASNIIEMMPLDFLSQRRRQRYGKLCVVVCAPATVTLAGFWKVMLSVVSGSSNEDWQVNATV